MKKLTDEEILAMWKAGELKVVEASEEMKQALASALRKAEDEELLAREDLQESLAELRRGELTEI